MFSIAIETALSAPLLVAALGTASAAIEAAAASVGAGVLLGGFLVGTFQRLVHGAGSRGRGDDAIVDAGYSGGWISVAVLVADLLIS